MDYYRLHVQVGVEASLRPQDYPASFVKIVKLLDKLANMDNMTASIFITLQRGSPQWTEEERNRFPRAAAWYRPML